MHVCQPHKPLRHAAKAGKRRVKDGKNTEHEGPGTGAATGEATASVAVRVSRVLLFCSSLTLLAAFSPFFPPGFN